MQGYKFMQDIFVDEKVKTVIKSNNGKGNCRLVSKLQQVR